MEFSALTRSVVKSNHAVICPDGYVSSNIPGWTNCTSNIVINAAMGANLCQIFITLTKNGKLTGKTKTSQIFFYILEGSCIASISREKQALKKGQFVYVPIEKEYTFENAEDDTQILTFHKAYEHLECYDVPGAIFGDSASLEGQVYLGDPALQLQVLLPDTWSFDMAVNIFTYSPGGHLPFIETHMMEHGLMQLRGQGVYMLDGQWYPIKKGDSIWMAPYCSQWFTAIGKEPAVYIYYKNVNRFPIMV